MEYWNCYSRYFTRFNEGLGKSDLIKYNKLSYIALSRLGWINYQSFSSKKLNLLIIILY